MALSAILFNYCIVHLLQPIRINGTGWSHWSHLWSSCPTQHTYCSPALCTILIHQTLLSGDHLVSEQD